MVDYLKTVREMNGKECPCKKGRLYQVGPLTLQCSFCHELVHVGLVDPFPRGNRITIQVLGADGSKREFWAPKNLAPEDLLHDLMQAYCFLEGCSTGWIGADSLQTIFQMLQFNLEQHGIIEGLDETKIVNGEESWQDGSVLGSDI